MKKIDFIVQDLLSKIYQNQNKLLPNQRTLAKNYNVSRYTIQRAIKNLEEIGVVHSVQGSGIYINKNIYKNPLIFNSLTRTPYERIQSKMISLKKSPSTSIETKIFQLNEGELVWTFTRLRIVDYKIEQLETSKMPVYLFPDLSKKIIENSIHEYVENKKFKISHSITNYSPTILSKKTASLFNCKTGTPAMDILTRSFLDNGQVYEYTNILAIEYNVTYITPFDRNKQNARK